METVKQSEGQIGILFVHANNVDVGGADYCMLKIVRELDRTKFRPIVALRVRTRIVDLYEQVGVKVILLPLVRWQRQMNFVKFVRALLIFPLSVTFLIVTIIKERVQIVHSNDLLDVVGSFAGKLTGRYAIQHVRMIVIKNSFLRRFVSKLLSIANDKILCVSDAVRQWFFDTRFIKSSKAEVLYDWVDMDSVGHAELGGDIHRQLSLPKETPLVVLVGRMEWWKGHHVFIRSAQLVHRNVPDAHFLIVGGKVFGRGREFYEDELRQLTQTLGIADHVHFLGEREDVLNVLQQITIAVHSSVEPDPFPGVVLEAMYAGKPVVAARGGGVVEQVEERISGLLYEPGNDRDLAEKLIYLLENRQKGFDMGLKGQRMIQTKFNKEKILEQLVSLYTLGAAA